MCFFTEQENPKNGPVTISLEKVFRMSHQTKSQHKGTNGALHRYSAKRMAKPVNFVCSAPGATQVSVVGDFNEWEPRAHPMRRQPDGAWMAEVQLSHGHHHYLFSVDGQKHLDPRAQGIARNAEGERVSLIAVS
jgi:1,4-alpha-glucan branching enzyme